MKRVAGAWLTAASLLLLAAPPAAAVAVHVEYLAVPPESAQEFRTAVGAQVRDLNRQRLERGDIFAWYHYASRFPLGSASDYTDVMVTVFTDFASLQNPGISAGYADWVRHSEVYQGVPGVRSEDYYGKVEYTHVTVDFLTAGAAGTERFLDTMRGRVMPRLQARADAGEVVNWALFAKRLPVGGERGYEYALVSRFNGFGRLATPQITDDDAAHLHRSVVWQLKDILE